jgi:SprT-like family
VKIRIPAGADPHHMYLVWRMATDLMDDHGLRPDEPGGWRFFFDNAPVRAGACNREERYIALSGPVVMHWPMAEIRDTILHEIAHARTNGMHGREWKAMCHRIGARPEACYPAELRPPQRYVGTCPFGHRIFRQRLPKIMTQSCGRCQCGYDARYPVTWSENTEALT